MLPVLSLVVRAPMIRAVLLVMVLAAICVGLWQSRPPHDLTIDAGPVGGSYYENALRYRDILAARGIDLHIVPKENSLLILNEVATRDRASMWDSLPRTSAGRRSGCCHRSA